MQARHEELWHALGMAVLAGVSPWETHGKLLLG